MSTPVQDAKAGEPLTVGDIKQGVGTLKMWTTILKKAFVTAYPAPQPGSDEGMAVANLTDAANKLGSVYNALAKMNQATTILVDNPPPNGRPRLVKTGDCRG